MTHIQLSNKKVIFTKSGWTPSEIEDAMCLGFALEGNNLIADPGMTTKMSLWMFIKKNMTVFTMDPGNYAYMNSFYQSLSNLYDEVEREFNDTFFSKLEYPLPLYGHQTNSVFQMAPKKCNLLSFEQGLGKTITSATLSKVFNLRRTIVICPSLVKWNWYHELTETWGFDPFKFTVLDRNKKKSITAFQEWWVIINFEMVEKYFDYLTRDVCDHIIIDECHYIKNTKTKRYKGVKKLVDKFPNARITLLSGTPITNRVNDLFAYCKLTGHPLGSNYAQFLNQYTISNRGSRGVKILGAKNVDDLRFKMSNFMIRKKTEECVDLPELIINKYFFHNEDYKKEYEGELLSLVEKEEEYGRLSDKEKTQMAQNIRASLHTLNRIIAISKIKGIIELIDSLRDMGRKVIVFSSYTDPLNKLLEHYGLSAVKIDGSINSYDRDQNIQRFKNDPECQVFLGNVKAAGVGINLVNSSDVIFCNFPFTPDDLEQPYKRAHRIGQKNNVNVYYTICKDSIDENIYGMIVDKTSDINEIIDKGKDGVVNYSSIPNKIFKDLVNEYKEKNKVA